MQALTAPLAGMADFQRISEAVRADRSPMGFHGLMDAQKHHFLAGLAESGGSPLIVVTFNALHARKVYEDFACVLGDDALYLPPREVILHAVEARSHEQNRQRIRTLDRMLSGQFRVVVAPVEACVHRLMTPERFSRASRNIRSGAAVMMEELVRWLAEAGYERADYVEGPGQFAVRGGIVDLYSPQWEIPCRIEFFGDEVDSIREVDPETQRSTGRLDEVRLLPGREVLPDKAERLEAAEAISRSLETQLTRMKKGTWKEQASRLEETVGTDIQRLREGAWFSNVDRYTVFLPGVDATVFNYAPDAWAVMDEWPRQTQRLENMLLEHQESCRGLVEAGRLLPEVYDLLMDETALLSALPARRLFAAAMMTEKAFPQVKTVFALTGKTLGGYAGHLGLLVEDLQAWKSQGSRVMILAGTRGKARRLAEELEELGVNCHVSEDPETVQPGQIMITRGAMTKGFEYPQIGWVVLSESETGGGKKKARRAKSRDGSKIKAFTDLAPGDFVVHPVHGIGQYTGLEKLVVDKIQRDYLKIRYASEGYIYIPSTQLEAIQKYIGPDSRDPKLSKLGGADWAKAKEKVKASLREMAGELVKLYAERSIQKGYACTEDTPWQKEFEDMFPFEETVDQLRAVEDIKRDMESDRPMERLLCGDVGFGKTEVALRAMFKMVSNSRQVAYLVPTTVLCQQQFENFRKRFADFPVTVEMLSRFRTPAEEKKILAELKAGNIDVLVGTHKLLKKSMPFRNLGLLVVDEEQRFGVAHKEAIKNLRTDIDVLTLSATPIPRTLHMALNGIRDISLLEEPPEERYPVQTYVMEHDPEMLRDGIVRELARQGQVYYLYNRVRTIREKQAELERLVPGIRVGVAHGQMGEHALEVVMEAFIQGEYDLLLCTTIVESGLDIPNVNTLIVEDADRLGLAQLYQIRGRVGRSNRLAYAYITYKRDKTLSETAEKRLQAIREFTEFGSGFKIAMRDLEIRGAGNLLGGEQHGHMETVGYEMYCRLLEEAVAEMGGPVREQAVLDEVTVDVPVSAYIDDQYIRDGRRKIAMYKRIATAVSEQDFEDIADELIDLYGDIPAETQALLDVGRVRWMAGCCGFETVQFKNGLLNLTWRRASLFRPVIMGPLTDKYRRSLLLSMGDKPGLSWRMPEGEGVRRLGNIKILLQDILKLQKDAEIQYNNSESPERRE